MNEPTDNGNGRTEELKPVLIFKNKSEIMPCSKIVVPASMRSPLWKFFGFPADEYNNILSKTKIVCCLCHAYFAYNKNTTNLSTHLKAKHTEIMSEYFPSKKRREIVNGEKTSVAAKRSRNDDEAVTKESFVHEASPMKFDRIEHPTGIEEKDIIRGNANASEMKYIVSMVDGNEFIEMHYDNKDYIEMVSDECAEILSETPNLSETDETASETIRADYFKQNYLTDNNLVIGEDEPIDGRYSASETNISIGCEIDVTMKTNADVANHNDDDDSGDHNDVSDQNANESMARSAPQIDILKEVKRFLVTDIISPFIVDGKGFKEFVEVIGRNQFSLSRRCSIETELTTEYTERKSDVMSTIESIVKNRKFSFCFERWESTNGTVNFVISCNSVVDEKDEKSTKLKRHIIDIIASDDLEQFLDTNCQNMENCSAVVINWNSTASQIIETFFKAQNIPVIKSFPTVIEMAVEKCREYINQCIEDLDRSGRTNIANQDKTWSKSTLSAFVRCTQPLNDCLTALAQENNTSASVMKPLAQLLINEHFTMNNEPEHSIPCNGIDICELKRVVVKELRKNLSDSKFLTMATFFDPRFQNHLSATERNSVRSELEKTLNNDETHETNISVEEAPLKIAKKVGLSSLFSKSTLTKVTKSNQLRFEKEFRNYTEDASVDIEQCPIDWWTESATVYPRLKQVTDRYFCVPAFVNDFHRLDTAECKFYESKFRSINTEIDRHLLWLHLHQKAK